ncbi:MAG: hypothetical protein IPK82_07190 [Polyangiaceae bacterium]|nr:hypothetical protein [Polyangiaceae bacterium]
MSLIITAVAIGVLCASAGGGYLLGALRGRSPAKDDEQPDKKNSKNGDKKGEKLEKKPQRADPKKMFESLPLCLGDVVTAEGEERWLAGGLIATEGDRVVAAVFFAPEGSRTKAVAAFARPRRDILWLSPARCDSPAEPPGSCEIEGVPMTRRGRIPVVIARYGQGVPNIGENGIFAEYEGGADEIAVLITSEGRSFAWSGKRLIEGDYDRLGSGGDDEAEAT